jgi:UDP-N-acetylmuramoyl-tripeptide--D-alanyl-D-alanine ligase
MPLFPITLGALARVVGGRLVRGNPGIPVHHAIYMNVHHVNPGTVFIMNTRYMKKFPLSWLNSLKSAGIIAPATHGLRIPRHHPLILVKSPDAALWRLAAWQRSKIRATVIGITGSQGKTTTKEMLASILMRKYFTYKSPSNINTASSIPNHLFNMNAKHQMAVLEMGMSSFGNIRKQCLFARPTIGVVTNVGEAHVGKLGHLPRYVAKAKQELIDGLAPGGLLVLNADDRGSKLLSTRRYRGKVVTVGIRNPATIMAKNIRFEQGGMRFQVGNKPYFIRTWGRHHVYNALAAIAVARALHVPDSAIREGLAKYRVPHMRLQRIAGIRGYLLINDAYNANPSSMIAGLQVLKEVSGNRFSVAVLGDILELGNYTVTGHARVGKVVGLLKPSFLITVGPLAVTIARSAAAHGMPRGRIRSFNTQSEALQFILRTIPRGSVLYFKASRKVGLEWLVKRLTVRK